MSRPDSTTWAAGSVALLALVAALVVVGSAEERGRAAATVLAVDEVGRPVDGAVATVLHSGVTVTAEDRGRLSLDLDEPALVSVTATGHLPRVLAAAPDEVSHAVLTSNAEDTLSVRVGGDVMFGRRYYDPDEDGRTGDGLLQPGADAAAHAALLEHVAPLLADADVTVVNLETPLVDEPWFDVTGPRPAGWHPTKEFVFASAAESVPALTSAGVDAVSLGNNHVLDAMDDGLARTIAVLDAAGVPHFGAGMDEDTAWRPALLERDGRTVAMIGCTTITGTEHVVPYVAGDGRAGAARCTRQRLRAEVVAARAVADVVLVMVHGGEEYEAEQTDLVRGLSDVAAEAGAALVVNGHPHVVGGMTLSTDASLLVETTGNLLFDQDVWPTFLSYLVRADVRGGDVVHAQADPMVLDDYVPRPVTGHLAAAAARRAAGVGMSDGTVLLAATAVAPGPPSRSSRTVTVSPDEVVPLPPGWWLEDGAVGVRAGADLLWSGSFEDEDTDQGSGGGGSWALSEANGRLTAQAACSGSTGVELRRSGLSEDDALLTPDHRQLVAAGTPLSLLVDVRQAGRGGVLELRTYRDTRGTSSTVAVQPIPAWSSDGCTTVRLDLVAPPGTVAVQPFVRLGPPSAVQGSARLAVDDVRLIAWGAEGGSGPRWSHLEAVDAAEVELRAVEGTPWP